MSDHTTDPGMNAAQFHATARDGSNADPLLEATRRLQSDAAVRHVVDPENPGQEQDWDPWG